MVLSRVRRSEGKPGHEDNREHLERDSGKRVRVTRGYTPQNLFTTPPGGTGCDGQQVSSVAIKGIVNEHTPVVNPTWPGAALLGQIRGLIEQSMYNRAINNLAQWIDLFADKDTQRTPQSIRLPVPWGAAHRSCLY